MDETLPLLANPEAEIGERLDEDARKDIVDFDPQGDAENPMEWPAAYKWSIVALLALTAFTVTFTCTAVVPIANRIVEDLDGAGGRSSKSASVLLVTIWELGEAAGPLFIGPLSEIFGRYPVINAANVLFIGSTALAALCRSSAAFIAARVLTGLAVATNVLGPAIIGDIFPPEQRGSAMSLVQLAPLIGGAIGPGISGAIAETLGWRRVVLMSVVLAGVCEVTFLSFFRETYRVPILRRRAARLRRETGNASLRTVFDLEGGGGPGFDRVWEAAMRPGIVFFGSGVLQAIALFGAIVFTFFYIMSVTLPDIMGDIYGLSPALIGLAFIGSSVGSFISVVICNLTLDAIYVRLREKNKGIGQPEYRLPLVIVGGFIMPFFIALYGWVPQLRLPLPYSLLSIVLLTFSQMFGFLPLVTYVVDAFGLYSASALTALIVTRCLMGTFLPLAVHPLVEKCGYGWAFTIMGGILLCVAPIPVVLMRYGAVLRQRSQYTRES